MIFKLFLCDKHQKSAACSSTAVLPITRKGLDHYSQPTVVSSVLKKEDMWICDDFRSEQDNESMPIFFSTDFFGRRSVFLMHMKRPREGEVPWNDGWKLTSLLSSDSRCQVLLILGFGIEWSHWRHSVSRSYASLFRRKNSAFCLRDVQRMVRGLQPSYHTMEFHSFLDSMSNVILWMPSNYFYVLENLLTLLRHGEPSTNCRRLEANGGKDGESQTDRMLNTFTRLVCPTSVRPCHWTFLASHTPILNFFDEGNGGKIMEQCRHLLHCSFHQLAVSLPCHLTPQCSTNLLCS